jgi:lysophospholipase L1-like esterase
MKIETIDKNFSLREKAHIEGDRAHYTLPHSAFSLHGISYDEKEERFTRMDLSVAESVSEGVGFLSRHTAGGRLRFATDSSVLQVTVKYDFLWLMSHMPLTGSSGFSLFEETEKGEIFIKNLAPISSDAYGFTAETPLKGGVIRNYILYFPLYNDVKEITIALDKNAQVKAGKKYRDELPILYYGSSITQGGCASRPDHAYQSLIAKRNNIDYINLGFSGSAKGEDVMVDYLASINCGLFVCDYDHNAPNAEHLKNTHYRLYQRYRKMRHDTPILFLTRPDITGDVEGEERLKIVFDTYKKAKKDEDENVYFLSGKSFYGKKNRWDFAVDGCHPTDFGFVKMADKIYKKMISIDEKYRG